MRKKITRRWRRCWLHFAGPHGFGQLAARMAALGTLPYHGRACLAYMNARGFMAHTAVLVHPGLRLGKNVYIGDGVMVVREPEGGRVELGDRVQLYGNTFLSTGSGGCIRIGEETHVQLGCRFHAFISEIVVGRNVEIAPNCAFYSYNHGMAPGTTIMCQPIQTRGPIVVGDGAWLGHGTIVLSGVQIGAGAVVGAGSVVVKSVPPDAIAAGAPAKVIRFRDGSAEAPAIIAAPACQGEMKPLADRL